LASARNSLDKLSQKRPRNVLVHRSSAERSEPPAAAVSRPRADRACASPRRGRIGSRGGRTGPIPRTSGQRCTMRIFSACLRSGWLGRQRGSGFSPPIRRRYTGSGYRRWGAALVPVSSRRLHGAQVSVGQSPGYHLAAITGHGMSISLRKRAQHLWKIGAASLRGSGFWQPRARHSPAGRLVSSPTCRLTI
jgi:hypothetical protein